MMERGVGGDAVAIKRERYRKSLAMLEDEIPESELVEILRLELETLPPDAPAEGA
jgi:folate-dependent tRNA-U54 methylase TrmFO/GidA